MKFSACAVFVVALAVAPAAKAQGYLCEDTFQLPETVTECLRFGPEQELSLPKPKPPSFFERYAAMFKGHRLEGEASYYSASLDGGKTANGEIYRAARFSAAHLTLPLGCWIEVKSRATGRVIQLRVNDRGPYTGGFVLDLSRSAARFLGVDVAADRRVDIKVIAMPGEKPPSKEEGALAVVTSEESEVATAAK
jgi:rare lipoprotein A